MATDLTAAVRRLARRLASLPEGAMRRAVLAEALTAAGPAESVALLKFLRDCAPLPQHPEYTALETFGALLAVPGALPYPVVAAIYEEAHRAGAAELARFLLGSPAAAAIDADTPLPPDPRVAEVPLGARKQLARRQDRDHIERLLADPAALVIRQLLQNPRLTEKDVLKIAARRPAVADVLREVFRAERWVRRYSVKRALCLNPYTPGEITARLLPLLRREDLKLVATDATLHERVRGDARRLAAAVRTSSRPPTRR